MGLVIANGKVVVFEGKLGIGESCCGCCCIDGAPDKTKTNQADCEDAGGTWNGGTPCDKFPICSDCFSCGAGNGFRFMVTINFTFPDIGNGCPTAWGFTGELVPFEGIGNYREAIMLSESEGRQGLGYVGLYCVSTPCVGLNAWRVEFGFNYLSPEIEFPCDDPPFAGAGGGGDGVNYPYVWLTANEIEGDCVPLSPQTRNIIWDIFRDGSFVSNVTIEITLEPV